MADDHTMFRQGLEAILASRGGIEVVGSTSTGPEAAERVRQTKPDVVVTQLDMQPKTAQEIIEGLREASPGSRIVVLTLWDNARYLKAVAAMGVDALMHKSSTAEELVAIVEAASLRPGGGNAVVSLPRAFLEKMDGGPAASPTGRSRYSCSPPAASRTARYPGSSTSPRRRSSATWPTSTRSWGCAPGTTR